MRLLFVIILLFGVKASADIYSDVTQQVVTLPGAVSSATLSSVTNAVTSFLVAAANSSRHGLIIFNDSTTTCDIAFAATASLTSFSIQIPSKNTYFMSNPAYSGAISGICVAANGSLRVTDL